VKNGGDAFIRAFEQRFKELGVDVLCGRCVVECRDIREHRVGRFVLNSGEEIAFDNCVATMHPKEILKMLPAEYLSKAFVERVAAFEPSFGFFSVFATLSGSAEAAGFGETIVSLLPSTDLNQMFDPAYTGDRALVVMGSNEESNGKTHRVIHAFEASLPQQFEPWKDSTVGRRGPDYEACKADRIERIVRRTAGFFPSYKENLRVLDAASVLTFRDYLHSPDGSAYGVKQKIGQFNLVGKLPLYNIYAAGQSAILPGVVGAMMSSFIVCRSLLGRETFDRFIHEKVGV
jgi:phytoene dehydrogenase-like protein